MSAPVDIMANLEALDAAHTEVMATCVVCEQTYVVDDPDDDGRCWDCVGACRQIRRTRPPTRHALNGGNR